MDLTVRFHENIDSSSVDGCWPWTGGSVNKDGYGVIWFARKSRYAHRVSLALSENKDIRSVPSSMYALHHCDNPICCRPSHLYWGTHADNTADRVRRGRQADVAGIKNPRAKIGVDDVRAIRRRLAAGESQKVIAADYGLPRQSVWKIQHGRGWTSVA